MKEYTIVLGVHVAWTGALALLGWFYVGNAMLTMWARFISITALLLAVLMYVSKEEND